VLKDVEDVGALVITKKVGAVAVAVQVVWFTPVIFAACCEYVNAITEFKVELWVAALAADNADESAAVTPAQLAVHTMIVAVIATFVLRRPWSMVSFIPELAVQTPALQTPSLVAIP